jgi:hypothetical protein
VYTIANDCWEAPQAEQLLLHSHAAGLDGEKWISFGGFTQRNEDCHFTNEVRVKQLNQPFLIVQTKGFPPQARINCASAMRGHVMIIHGGINP